MTCTTPRGTSELSRETSRTGEGCGEMVKYGGGGEEMGGTQHVYI